MSKTTAQFEKLIKETTDFGASYSEACTKSAGIIMKGAEDIVGAMMSLAQNSAEKQSKFMKEAMGVKTINEFAEVQNKIAQTNFDDFMAGATKISEISAKVLTEGVEPVSAQVSETINKATQRMAA
ncbi:MAG: phasin family protein [Alphaproteobacteria bacterium]